MRLGLAAFSFLLVQGSAWWWLRLALLSRDRALELSTAPRRAFRVLDGLNRVLLVALVPALVLVGNNGRDTLLGFLFYLFAVIEYVNYFHVRLSYGRSGFNLLELWRTPRRPSSIRKLLG